MGGKAVIAAGLVTGLVAGAVLVGAIVLLGPPPAAPTPTASPVAGEPGASPSGGSPVPSGPAASGEPPASASTAPSGDPGEAFGVGRPAPSLSVPQLGGGTVELGALRGSPVWVNFMATWCPPCRDEIPRMNGFATRYADTGLVVLAIDVREDEALVDAFSKELGIVFPVGLDRDGGAQAEWGAYALPVHFWIDAEGIVRDGALGGIGPDVMAQGLEAILPGVEVTP